MGGRGAPVEAAGDDGAVVDDSELVVQFVEMGLPAWFLRDAQGAGAIRGANLTSEAVMGRESGYERLRGRMEGLACPRGQP